MKPGKCAEYRAGGKCGRNGGRLCLGIQWDAESWQNAPLWCDYLFGKLDTRQVHWNIPALPAHTQRKKRASFTRALRGRIEANGDPVTAMGFTGACHPLLNLDELAREISWGLRNPWGTGLTDLLDVRPTVLIPPVPDLSRAEAWRLYRAHGFSRVGIGCEPRRGAGVLFPARYPAHFLPARYPAHFLPARYPAHFLPARYPAHFLPARYPAHFLPDGGFPCLRFPVARAGPGDPLTRQVRRLIAAGGSLFLLLDLSELDDLAPLRFTFEWVLAPLLTPGGRALSSVAEAFPEPPPRKGAPECVPDWSPFPALALHEKIGAAAGISRRKRKKAEEYQELLAAFAPGDVQAPPGSEDGEDSSSRSRLLAHMQGEVVLSGPEFDVQLTGGRFSGITQRGETFLPLRQAGSYLRIGGRTMTFRTVSSFSFEGESGTGLREELGLAGEPDASLSIEYSFREDCPQLSVKAEIRFPRMAAAALVEEYAPLAIVLAELPRGGSATVQTTAPDGSIASATIAERTGWRALPGAAARIVRPGARSVVVRYGAPDSRRWGVPFFRIARARGARILEMNPFGSYAPVPAAALSGRSAVFSLLLGFENASQ
jgi:hypothetical protein